ncbi:hypothetical protein [Cohnella sp.]|uniref:hypothetical protein n=1 Tax=Cohnella sp. TaxID=1883426 RepID=UPI003565DCEC
MPKLRQGEARSLLRKSASNSKAKLSSRQIQSKPASGKNKKESNEGDILRLHQSENTPSYTTRPIPWWVFPEAHLEGQTEDRGLFGGLFGGGGPGGPGGFPGPGGPGGPGGFPGPGGPGGPGGFPGPGGPGPFPPPYPPYPPGPGPFPPPYPPYPPGPGPFPPPYPPYPPYPPFPPPFPPPYPPYPPYPPGPGPFPPPYPPSPPFPPAYITVRIVGGAAFPRVNYTRHIRFYPGITIRQALASTSLVNFGPAGFIRNVAGIPIYGNTEVRLRYNGRVIPQTLLFAPAAPGSTVSLELYYSFAGAVPSPL